MKSKLLSGFKYLFLFSIGLGLLWLTFRKENLAEIAGKLSQADPWWLAVSVVLAIGAFYSRAIRWVMLMEPLGFKPKLSSTLYALFLGYFANLAIPRIGEITRCGALANSEKVPFNSLIGTVIVERVIDLLMLFFSMVLVAILEYDLLSRFLSEKVVSPLMDKFSFLQNPIVIAGLVLSLLLLVWILWRMSIKKENESAFSIKVRGIMHEIASGFKTILRMKNTGWFVFHTFFIWFLYFLMTWVCFFCLQSTAHLDMKAGMFVLVVGGLGMSAPVQGGIGAYHYIVSQGLQLFGVSSTDGIVYATLVHTTQTLLVVFLGIFALVMLFISGKKKSSNEQAGVN
ncbi:MAG: flippase-like domain-containing protein [Bacteroidetes bacterium]|nr:flippase-like domain-containing protein [Bacteroidota bacterium]